MKPIISGVVNGISGRQFRRARRVCVPNKVKNINEKVFNLISRVNQTRFLIQYELCECKCRLTEIACNSKQKWNHNECRRQCK